MVKLKNIYNEIKLANPNITKKQLIESFLDGHAFLLESISSELNNNMNLENMLKTHGYDNISDFLTDEHGYEDEKTFINKMIQMIELFFLKQFHP